MTGKYWELEPEVAGGLGENTVLSSPAPRSVILEDSYPNRDLPSFWWLKVTGQPGVYDFGFHEFADLIVSDRVWQVIQPRVRHCDVKPFPAARL